MAKTILMQSDKGKSRTVSPREARVLTALGWSEVLPEDRFANLPYQELRALVSSEGLEAASNRKPDLIAALQSGYRRRDLRAEP